MNAGRGEPTEIGEGRASFQVSVTQVRWLADRTVELRFERPEGFDFLAGQKIGVVHDACYRDYSLAGSSRGGDLAICVRWISNGALSPMLAGAKVGQVFQITAAFGYFLHQPSQQPDVFVATGTGIAPFAAFVRAGARPSRILHGVRATDELYYRDLLSPSADQYVPCLSGSEEDLSVGEGAFQGRVTDYLKEKLPPGAYDFYLCGRGEMLRDAMRIIDQRFDGSRVYSEMFF